MDKSKKTTARSELLKFMKTKNGMKNGITSDEAFERFGITRLSAVIFDFKKQGIIIERELFDTTNRYGMPCSVAIYYYRGEEKVNE